MRHARKKWLLKRDSYICGKHLGGCGERITNSQTANSTVDHIIPRGYYHKVTAKQEDMVDLRRDFEQDWNLQPMHGECNRNRGGQLNGYPRFQCGCHFLHITKNDLYVCAWEGASKSWHLHKIVDDITLEKVIFSGIYRKTGP